MGVVPGGPQRLSSLPVTMAVSPDGRWVVMVTAGYGSADSGYQQGLAVVETATGTVREFPDARTGLSGGQVLFSGLAFSGDGTKVYASLASLTDPAGEKTGDTGTGVAVYSFGCGLANPKGERGGAAGRGERGGCAGGLAPVGIFRIPRVKLGVGQATELGKDKGLGMPYPAAIAVVPSGCTGAHPCEDSLPEPLLVADNLSDDVLLMDSSSGAVVTRFDLSEGVVVPSTYPIDVKVSADGRRGFVALWNASEVVELDLVKGVVGRRLVLLKGANPVLPGSHPDALALAPDGKTLYVALGNRDAVAAVDLNQGGFALKGYFDARLPGQSFYGSQPEALAVSADGKRLYCADMGSNAVAVMDTGKLTRKRVRGGMVEPVGFVPTEWLPMAVASVGGKLYIATGKGTGTGPNNMPQAVGADGKAMKKSGGFAYVSGFVPITYIPTLLHGSLAVVPEVGMDLKGMTSVVLEGNRMRAGGERIGWDAGVLARVRVAGGVDADGPGLKPASSGVGFRGLKPPANPGTALGGQGGAEEMAGREQPHDNRDAAAVIMGHPKGSGDGVSEQPQVTDDEAVRGLGHPKRFGEQPKESGFASGVGPIRHVIYIIRENRTYDQVLGDLVDGDGKKVGNGDASLAMYGMAVTPNLHKLALQFGVLDNFYDSAEVSGDGHVWSNTAIGTDYLERTWQDDYRGKQRGYDYEGVVSEGLPLEQRIPDVNEPGSGYIWGNVARHGLSLLHFGEYINSVFCSEVAEEEVQLDPQAGPMGPGRACSAGNAVKPGERLPEVWGGGVNRYGWAIPLLALNRATKPELVGHFATEYPDFNLKVPDQVREDIFERHLAGWVKDRAAGHDTMPNFVMLRLANDHTAGTTVGSPTPRASVADNDLAVGRAVEAISHSAYWDDTAFFILEDDAQNGADHVDAHRSLGVVVSKYAPRLPGEAPFVDSRFYSTVSMVRTMEMVLGLPPMNNNDALSSAMGSLFTGKGVQGAFVADRRNEANGLIYKANEKSAVGAKESAKMDFKHADRAPAEKLNVILWRDAMGEEAVPAMLTEKRRKGKKDDDD